MKDMLHFTLWVVYVSLFVPVTGAEYKKICYYMKTPGQQGLKVQDIDPSLCTHIVLAHAGLQYNKIQTIDQSHIQLYTDLTGLKTQHPHLKVLLSVGGEMAPLSELSLTLQTHSTRTIFVTSCIDTLRQYGFDGLDLYFDHPGKEPGSVPQDRARFGLLLQEMKQAFDAEAAAKGRTALLLSVIVQKETHIIEVAYNVEKLAKYADIINVFTYHFHDAQDTVTGHQAPLYEQDPHGLFGTKRNMNYIVFYWIRLGVPREKLVVGLAVFANGFLLSDTNKHGFGAPVSGPSTARPSSGKEGILSYPEVCGVIADGATTGKNYVQQVPFLYKDTLWAGYENPESLENKVRWLKIAGLGGYFVWGMELDDYTGTGCGGIKYPLMTAMSQELMASPAQPLPPPSYLLEVKCGHCVNETSSRLHCDAYDMTKYYGCTDGLVLFMATCPADFSPAFSPSRGQCVSYSAVQTEDHCKDIVECGRAPEGLLMDRFGLDGVSQPWTWTTTTDTPSPTSSSEVPSQSSTETSGGPEMASSTTKPLGQGDSGGGGQVTNGSPGPKVSANLLALLVLVSVFLHRT